MTALQVLGALLCASPFIALFIYVSVEEGVRVALGAFAFTAAVIAIVAAGVLLMFP